MSNVIRNHRHPMSVVAGWDQDGVAYLEGVVVQPVPGTRILGNGTLQAPLTVELEIPQLPENRLAAALRAIIAKAPSGERPDEEDFEDTETASSKGYDAGVWDAAHELAEIAQAALENREPKPTTVDYEAIAKAWPGELWRPDFQVMRGERDADNFYWRDAAADDDWSGPFATEAQAWKFICDSYGLEAK